MALLAIEGRSNVQVTAVTVTFGLQSAFRAVPLVWRLSHPMIWGYGGQEMASILASSKLF